MKGPGVNGALAGSAGRESLHRVLAPVGTVKGVSYLNFFSYVRQDGRVVTTAGLGTGRMGPDTDALT